MEDKFNLGLQMLKIAEPLTYIRKLVDHTVDVYLSPFVKPPEDTRYAIRFGLFQIINNIYQKSDLDITSQLYFGDQVAEQVSRQTNLHIRFDDFYRKSVTAVLRLRSEEFELRAEFEDYLKSFLMPV